MNMLVPALFALNLGLPWGGPPRPAVCPQAVPFVNLTVGGELQERLQRNMNRMEEAKYRPDQVFVTMEQSGGWPGDLEGRTILALVLDARAAKRTPKHLDEILRRFPGKVNEKGYFGPVYPDVVNEQQLSSHGWVLRGLCEHYLWTGSDDTLKAIHRVVDGLVLPTAGFHRRYPVDPAAREHGGSYSGTHAKRIGDWLVSSDIGCDFIFMDGVVQAWEITGRKELRPVIDEMVELFLRMDLVSIKAQTHASLTGMRAVLRYYERTGDPRWLKAVEERFALYKATAMTETYENYNWFGRPEWTEPCAVVDSYMVAVQLWRFTGKPVYLEDAQHIYYNALGFAQRANGGFGLSTCPGAQTPFLDVKCEEAHWCCSMRGGEGLARVAQSTFFSDRRAVFVTDFRPAQATLRTGRGELGLGMETAYPFEGRVKLTVARMTGRPELRLFAPGWALNPRVTLNGRSVATDLKEGFLRVEARLKAGDVIEYTFDLATGARAAENRTSESGRHKFFAGPLILARAGVEDAVRLPATARLRRQADHTFMVEGSDVVLRPVYHLMNPEVREKPRYRMQVMFEE